MSYQTESLRAKTTRPASILRDALGRRFQVKRWTEQPSGLAYGFPVSTVLELVGRDSHDVLVTVAHRPDGSAVTLCTCRDWYHRTDDTCPHIDALVSVGIVSGKGGAR